MRSLSDVALCALLVLVAAACEREKTAPADTRSLGGPVVVFDIAEPQMVRIPGGSFMMGRAEGETDPRDNEWPQHSVSIKPFEASKYEITWDQWDACIADNGCRTAKDDGFGKGSHPVTNVRWSDAKAYTAWLSKKTGKSYRLMSEAEWEYAFRAGTTTVYPAGDVISPDQANITPGVNRTVPVGQYAPNPFGLYDMAGNVREWLEDCFADDYASGQASDGTAFEGGGCDYRSIRGSG